VIHVVRSRRLRVSALLVLGAFSVAACRSPDKSDVEVEIGSVGFDSALHAPVVVLRDHDRKVALPIWIGPAEAQAIVMQLQGINPPRPMTHDLIKQILDGAGVEFQKVLIQEVKDSTYFARIFLHVGRHDLQVDSRPSDAIALAVRFHKPIFVTRVLMKSESAIDLAHYVPTASTAKFSGVTVQNLTAELAAYFNVPAGQGVIVADVASDAPQGLQRGDVILEMNGTAVTGVGDLTQRLQTMPNSAAARLSVQRGAKRIPVQFAGSEPTTR
jgi:uncharacterized protein